MSDVSSLDTATRGHHPDSPSSLQSNEACALFENEQRESLAAEAGVLQHKAVETRDLSLLEDPSHVAAVEKCIAYLNKVGVEKYAEAGEVTVLKEEYLSVGDERVYDQLKRLYVGITGGFPDEVYVAKYFADIFDWKFGAVPVTPTKDNLQGIAYALGLFEKFPDLQRVTVHFYQPHQGWSEEKHNEKYVHTFHRTEIVDLELRIRTVVAKKKAALKALEEKGSWAAAQPKNDLCIWCARKGDCTKNHARVIVGASKYSDFIVPEVLNPSQLTRVDQVAAAYKWANQVEKIAKAVKARCSEIALTEDLNFSGEMLIVKKTERKLKSFKALISVARKHGLKLREILPLISVPFTKVEEAVKAKAPKGKGAEAVRCLQQDFIEEGALEYGQPAYYLQEARSPKEKEKPVIQITN